MRAIESYTKVDPEFADARRRVRDYQRYYDESLITIAHLEKNIQPTRDIQDILSGYMKEILEQIKPLIPNDITISRRQDILNDIQALENNRGIKRILSNYNSAHNDSGVYLSRLAEAKDTLESLAKRNEESVITKESCEQALYSLDNVIPGSVELGTLRDTAYLEWGISGIQIKPNRNPYAWINNGGPVSIKLEDVKVSLRLRDGLLKLTALNPGADSMPYIYADEHHVHPHVINGHKPCLGDWGGPVTEAVHNCDWAVVSGMLTTFLSNADSEDSAGGKWHLGVSSGYRGNARTSNFFMTPNPEFPGASTIKFSETSQGTGEFVPTFYDADGREIGKDTNYHRFQVDDIVMIAETSVYYEPNRTEGSNPTNTEGRITHIDMSGGHRIRVSWPDGVNLYTVSDLVWVENPQQQKHKSVTELPPSSIAFPPSDVISDPGANRTIADIPGFEMGTDGTITGRAPNTPSLFD